MKQMGSNPVNSTGQSRKGELTDRKGESLESLPEGLRVREEIGLGGWTEGFLAEGWDVIGFDIERHRYVSRVSAKALEDGAIHIHADLDQYPAQLVLQDVLTLHGSQFRNADCIVASPPCQEW
jgi:hypothetical protein